MKRIFTLACVAMLTLCASAQVTFNAKLGGGMSWAPMSEKGSDEGFDNKGLFVGKIGFGAEIPVSQNFSVMPSLELAMKGGKYEAKDDEESISSKLNVTYLQIPVMAAYRLSLNDRLNMTLKAGPYFAYGLSGNMKTTVDINNVTETEKADIFSDKEMGGKAADRFDVGGILGVDFEYHRFVVGAELECGFTDMYKASDPSDNYSVKIKNLAAYVTVGYKF